MRAILCPNPGGPLSETRLADCPLPEPGPGEVRVRMRAVSLNPVDWKLCTGVAPWWQGPTIVGLDGAGEVEALGPDVTGLAPGDRVVWHHDLGRQGVFADYAIAPAHVLAPIPEGVSFAAAAALPCAGLTAYQGLVRKARLIAGETVLVQGASGGTGGFAVQIARALGARVIGLARPKDHARVRGLGAAHVLDYTAADLAEQLRALAPEGVDLMYEVVKPADATESFRHIRYNGQFVTTDPLPDLSQVPPYTYALSMHEVALGGAYGAGDRRTQADFATMLGALLQMVQAGSLDPMIEARIGFDAIPEYLGKLRARAVAGKIVAEV
jgi:NADPH:quinone reductase-like Zn-dependent oxidoreductase